MLNDNHLVSWVEVETTAKPAPYPEPVLSPNHVVGHSTCQLSGSYPDLVSLDSPSSDGASVLPGPYPVVVPGLPPVTVWLSSISSHEFFVLSLWAWGIVLEVAKTSASTPAQK